MTVNNKFHKIEKDTFFFSVPGLCLRVQPCVRVQYTVIYILLIHTYIYCKKIYIVWLLPKLMYILGTDDRLCIKLKIFIYYWNLFNINT